jgi:hypothetical protein
MITEKEGRSCVNKSKVMFEFLDVEPVCQELQVARNWRRRTNMDSIRLRGLTDEEILSSTRRSEFLPRRLEVSALTLEEYGSGFINFTLLLYYSLIKLRNC